MAASAGTIPPYVPFRTLKTHLADLREHGVPGRVDGDVLKKMQGSSRSQLKTGLRFLGLTDAEDHPTDDLHKLAAAYGTDEWKGALEGLLRARYAPFLADFNLAQATPSQFREKFRIAFKPTDEVSRKCEAFFLQAAQEAGFEISKRIPIITRQRSGGNGPNKRKAATKPDAKEDSGSSANKKRGARRPSNDVSDLEVSDLNLDPLLMELLRRIPAKADGWPKEQRLRWFKTFAVNVSEVFDDASAVDFDIKLIGAAK